MDAIEKYESPEPYELADEFKRQAELIGLADELARMSPPTCDKCGQEIMDKKW